MRFRKKPVVIDAIQFDGTKDGEFKVTQFGASVTDFWRSEEKLGIKTLEGVIYASKGDWIIKGIKGEFYPCKPDIFEATYEPVDQNPAPNAGEGNKG